MPVENPRRMIPIEPFAPFRGRPLEPMKPVEVPQTQPEIVPIIQPENDPEILEPVPS